jgi:heat shock protein 1/8
MSIKVFEGEHSMARDNYLLGSFQLFGIPAAPRRQPQIVVTFSIDANGILNVSAMETSSRIHGKMTITNDKGHLSKDEIKRRIIDADTYKKEDKIEFDRVRAKISLESYCYNIRTTINDEKIENTINSHDTKKILDVIEGTLTWLETNEVRHTLFLFVVYLFFFSLLTKKNSKTNKRKSKKLCRRSSFGIKI